MPSGPLLLGRPFKVYVGYIFLEFLDSLGVDGLAVNEDA